MLSENKACYGHGDAFLKIAIISHFQFLLGFVPFLVDGHIYNYMYACVSGTFNTFEIYYMYLTLLPTYSVKMVDIHDQ